jgi:hypothetical protein
MSHYHFAGHPPSTRFNPRLRMVAHTHPIHKATRCPLSCTRHRLLLRPIPHPHDASFRLDRYGVAHRYCPHRSQYPPRDTDSSMAWKGDCPNSTTTGASTRRPSSAKER